MSANRVRQLENAINKVLDYTAGGHPAKDVLPDLFLALENPVAEEANFASDLSNVIHDIGAEGPDDPYAKVVIPLIQRILADDYSGTGLFEAIDRELKLVETDPQLEAEIEAEEADIKAIQADAGLAQ